METFLIFEIFSVDFFEILSWVRYSCFMSTLSGRLFQWYDWVQWMQGMRGWYVWSVRWCWDLSLLSKRQIFRCGTIAGVQSLSLRAIPACRCRSIMPCLPVRVLDSLAGRQRRVRRMFSRNVWYATHGCTHSKEIWQMPWLWIWYVFAPCPATGYFCTYGMLELPSWSMDRSEFIGWMVNTVRRNQMHLQ